MSARDPLDLLARANPVPTVESLAPTATYLPAQRTLARLLDRRLPVVERGGPAGPDRRRRRSRRLPLAVAGAAAAAAILASAAAWVLTREPGDSSRVACYAAADLGANTAVVHDGSMLGPIAACQEVWATGAFQSWGPVPPLAACVRGGRAAVFPGDPSVCDRLGLARFLTESGDTATLSVQLVDNLVAALAAPNCVDVANAVDLVHQELDRLGLVGWTLIAPATAVPGRPCTSIAFDPPAKTITLVPVPPVTGSS